MRMMIVVIGTAMLTAMMCAAMPAAAMPAAASASSQRLGRGNSHDQR
jgi:hypothetical protein